MYLVFIQKVHKEQVSEKYIQTTIQSTSTCLSAIRPIVFHAKTCQTYTYIPIKLRNNTWVRGNTRFISSVEHDISRVSACSERVRYHGSTREINLVFPSTHVFFCLLYKQNSVKNNKTSVAMRFTTNDIFTRKNIVFFTCV